MYLVHGAAQMERIGFSSKLYVPDAKPKKELRGKQVQILDKKLCNDELEKVNLYTKTALQSLFEA